MLARCEQTLTNNHSFFQLASLNVVVGFAVLMYISLLLADSRSEVVHKLKDLQAKYDRHSGKNSSKDVEEASWRWNSVQETQEC